MDDLIDIFDKVADCEYKGEHYSARDNGAVMRHPKTPNRPRPKAGRSEWIHAFGQ